MGLSVQGPLEYLAEHRARVLVTLKTRDLTPNIFYSSAEHMNELDSDSIQLVVTSPPYPMIEMWDRLFEKLLHIPAGSFTTQAKPFELSHQFLDRIWSECYRVLEKGGILCINIGDATRTLGGSFQCYLNHARIAEQCQRIGFQSLVPILWRKPTNKPNAFLGSGFFPPNAYVTLDCEYILVFRKGAKRVLKPQDPLRYASQYSKAERDVWFSQTWDFRGERQNHAETAPFPEELPYRLIRMFSCLGDTVLDPFLGTGTTVKVARVLGRKGIGYEVNSSLKPLIEKNVESSSPRPEEVVDYLFRIYETSKDVPNILVSSRARNLRDKSLSSFR
jgi:site-specific DNA-methyltransferase (cytosine-N4-specific)